MENNMENKEDRFVLFEDYDQLNRLQSFYVEDDLSAKDHPEFFWDTLVLAASLLEKIESIDFKDSEREELSFSASIVGALTDLDLYFIKDYLDDMISSLSKNEIIEIPTDWEKELTWEIDDPLYGDEYINHEISAEYHFKVYKKEK